MHLFTCIAADRSLPRVPNVWPSTGARRGQDAGSALLRDEAVHTTLLWPRGCELSGPVSRNFLRRRKEKSTGVSGSDGFFTVIHR